MNLIPQELQEGKTWLGSGCSLTTGTLVMLLVKSLATSSTTR